MHHKDAFFSTEEYTTISQKTEDILTKTFYGDTHQLFYNIIEYNDTTASVSPYYTIESVNNVGSEKCLAYSGAGCTGGAQDPYLTPVRPVVVISKEVFD